MTRFRARGIAHRDGANLTVPAAVPLVLPLAWDTRVGIAELSRADDGVIRANCLLDDVPKSWSLRDVTSMFRSFSVAYRLDDRVILHVALSSSTELPAWDSIEELPAG